MNLLDHFHGPLEVFWPGFYNGWMSYIASAITDRLPEPYIAVPSGRFGFEVDVAAVGRMADAGTLGGWGPDWEPPSPSTTIPFAVATDEFEVRVFTNQRVGMELVGAIEFVSPANKDRPDHRDGFVSKCHGYLRDGIGLMIVDVVTSRHANLHDELMARIGRPGEGRPGHLYATAYRPTGANGDGSLDIWHQPLAVGRPLPTLPLWLPGGICVPADLAASYATTCRIVNVERVLRVFGPQPAAAPQ